MQRLFQGGTYFIGGLCRVQCLFEGRDYSRAVFNRVIRITRVQNPCTKKSVKEPA